MKKFASLLLAGLLTLSMAACSGTNNSSASESSASESSASESSASESSASESSASDVETPETVTITAYNAEAAETEIEVPYDPQRIAILDLAALDMIDNLGYGDRVVGSASTAIDYLSAYSENENIAALGTIKEADLEAVMACEPDVIFIGGRLSSSYDALSEIAPVVYLATDSEIGVIESVRRNATAIASMFGATDAVDALMAEFDGRIEALQAAAEGKTCVNGLVTSGSLNVLGDDGRCSIIGVEIGFENLGNGDTTSTHGNESSFELLVELNPDYIFVLDRDTAISAEGAQLAEEIMDNELVHQTSAYQNGQIVYLANPAVWYTAEGGITALDIMLSDLESALL